MSTGPTRKIYVTFMSPGTIVPETTTREIPEMHPPLAVRMAHEIEERHGARPYGFRFEERITHEPIPDGMGGTLEVLPKTIRQTGIFFLTGTVRRHDEIPESRSTDILRSNMRGNDCPLVIENRNSYTTTLPYEEADCVVDVFGNLVERGDAPKRQAERAHIRAAWAAARAA